jgi:hypothetical protein
MWFCTLDNAKSEAGRELREKERHWFTEEDKLGYVGGCANKDTHRHKEIRCRPMRRKDGRYLTTGREMDGRTR